MNRFVWLGPSGCDQFSRSPDIHNGILEHVGTVICLFQQKPDDVIRVGLDLDKLEVAHAEAKSAYGEIRAYHGEIPHPAKRHSVRS